MKVELDSKTTMEEAVTLRDGVDALVRTSSSLDPTNEGKNDGHILLVADVAAEDWSFVMRFVSDRVLGIVKSAEQYHAEREEGRAQAARIFPQGEYVPSPILDCKEVIFDPID